jgi:transposase
LSCCWSTPGTTRILPGRKTDVCDAAWLAELLEHGLLRGSFVPPPPIGELRDLTRYRKRLIQAHAAEGQRIQQDLGGCRHQARLGRR